MISLISFDTLRPKVISSINKYLSLSDDQSLAAGFYRDGNLYVLGNGTDPLSGFYDIGSISKTMTAHLILKLAEENLIDINRCISDYLELPAADHPTVYELLTHTAGYGHLTPFEITVPALLKHGYARKNIYEGCTANTVLKCLSRRNAKRSQGYSYSDFSYAILAVLAERVTGRRFCELITEFVQGDLGMKNTVISISDPERSPKAMLGKRSIGFWRWNEDNPYIAGGGLISNIGDMLNYIAIEIESKEPFITKAHRICEGSLSARKNIAVCIGWHTYKKSNQLWHVGGVGTFRSSVILNKKRKIGVAVLGNSKGVASANVHYLAKMLYSEMKINKIKF